MIKIKTIGIILRKWDLEKNEYTATKKDLFDYVNKFDVNIIGIPIDIEWTKIINVTKLCDGIVLSGGARFHENDFKLIDYLYKENIPTLGICLGMQTMGEYFNNKQEIDVDNHYHVNHKIKIIKDSKLYNILKQEEIEVNSRHHQAIPFTNMIVSAKSEDGVIEAVEMPNHKFFVGVQWHPESLDDNNSYLLMQSFINTI